MQESLRNRVRTEIEWLRRGPKARTTKSKSRINAANQMIDRLAAMDTRTTINTAGIDFTATERKTKRLVEFAGVSCEVEAGRLFGGLDFVLTSGMKLGVVGPNGSGKTSLLRLIKGDLEPAEGSIRRADALKMAYLSQMRELDESLTLRRVLAPDGDGLVYQGRNMHVASWAARFLFTGEQLNQPVENLSGGERARVLIAKLMLQPADILLLDEPTNDLDLPTLEILEDNLLEFEGALVLVTHDRYLLNRVASTVLGLSGNGKTGRFADYGQWEQWMADEGLSDRANRKLEAEPGEQSPDVTPQAFAPLPRKKKLSYQEAREFATIEQRIETSDARMAAAKARVEDPSIATDAAALQQAVAELEAAQGENEVLYSRWAELTDKAV